jgi:EAL domain-containing protein (putative c-di-GMP-specific phosphodiesterase class I)
MVPLAEGVETEEQRAFLLENGCRVGQGFLYSPAVPGDEIEILAGSALARTGPRSS